MGKKLKRGKKEKEKKKATRKHNLKKPHTNTASGGGGGGRLKKMGGENPNQPKPPNLEFQNGISKCSDPAEHLPSPLPITGTHFVAKFDSLNVYRL